MTPNWTWTLNNQKYPVYTKDLLPEAQILVRLHSTTIGFKDIAHL